MPELSKSKELQVIKAAETLADLVNAGADPTAALRRAAEQDKLTPEFVRRLAETTNTCLTLAHFKTAAPERRADEFPLADAEAVIRELYPEKQAVVHDAQRINRLCRTTWFDAPPDFTAEPLPLPKFAAAETVPLMAEPVWRRVRQSLAAGRRQLEVKQADADYCREMVYRATQEAVRYFFLADRRPFHEIESAVLTKHGEAARPLLDLVYKHCRGAERGERRGRSSADRFWPEPADGPYPAFDKAALWMHKWVLALGEVKRAEAELRELESACSARARRWRESRRRREYPFADIEKRSVGALGAITAGNFLADRLGGLLGEEEEDWQKEERRVRKAGDPVLNNALRTIQARSLLNELLTSDPVISGYDTQRVIDAYNEIVTTWPRVSEQPGLLRGLLARRLEMGRWEPFEAGQLLSAEQELRRTEYNPFAAQR